MEPNQPTDAELVAQTLAGDREAYGCLYDRHARIVRTVVGTFSLDWSTAEDMTQECFLRAYKKLPSLQTPDRFGSWIIGFARQIARERRRSLHRDRHHFVEHQTIEDETTFDETTILQNNEELNAVMQKLATLPEKERLAIHAFYLNGHNAHQVAELLQLSRSGFYALLQRALSRLAGLMKSSTAKEEVNKL